MYFVQSPYPEEDEEEDEEAAKQPQRAVRVAEILNLILINTKAALFSTRVMFSGEESCARQQRGNEAAPQ